MLYYRGKIFIVPLQQPIELEEKGRYTIYLTTVTTFEGAEYTIPEGYNGLDIVMTYNQNKVELTKLENIYEYRDEGILI